MSGSSLHSWDCVCGRVKLGKLKNIASVSSACEKGTQMKVLTKSDKAFALLLFDNYIDKWKVVAAEEMKAETEELSNDKKKVAARRRGKNKKDNEEELSDDDDDEKKVAARGRGKANGAKSGKDMEESEEELPDNEKKVGTRRRAKEKGAKTGKDMKDNASELATSDEEKSLSQRRMGKYTGANSGHCKMGGWIREGMARFNEFYALVQEDRASPNAAEMEKLLLAYCKAQLKTTPATGGNNAVVQGGASSLPDNLQPPVEAV